MSSTSKLKEDVLNKAGNDKNEKETPFPYKITKLDVETNKELTNCFIELYSPYWEHLKEGWNRGNEKNMLFLFYEDLNRDLRGTIEKVSRFLGKNYSSKEYDDLANHLKIENFRTNKSVNMESTIRWGMTVPGEENFIRKGGSGGWRDYFDEKLNSRADKWIEENLEDTDLRFPNVAL